MMYNTLKNKRLLMIILVIASIFPIIVSVIKSPIEVDAPYYLSILERVCDGYTPYKNLSFAYPPLWIYVLCVFKLVFSIGTNYTFYLIIHYLVLLVSTLLVGKIVFKLLNDVFLSVVAACLFLISSHWLEGNSVMLEIPSLMFGLLGLYLLMIKRSKAYVYFLAGVFVSFAFFVKQYGMGFLPLLLSYIVVEKSYSIKKSFVPMLWLVLGFCVPVVIFILIWDVNSLVFLLTGGGYGHNNISDAARGGLTLIDRLKAVFYNVYWFIRSVYPILFVIPLLFFINIDKVRQYKLLVFLFGFLVFFVQFAISHSMHYYLYSLPFAVILSVISIEDAFRSKKWVSFISIGLLVLTFLFSSYKTYRNKIYKGYYLRAKEQEDQKNLSKTILNITKGKGTLFVMQGEFIPQYFLTNMLPPNLSSIGYSYGPLALDEEKTIKQVEAADYILTVNEVECYSLEAACYTLQVEGLLKKYKRIVLDSRISLYVKR